jgi:hypothetical protein
MNWKETNLTSTKCSLHSRIYIKKEFYGRHIYKQKQKTSKRKNNNTENRYLPAKINNNNWTNITFVVKLLITHLTLFTCKKVLILKDGKNVKKITKYLKFNTIHCRAVWLSWTRIICINIHSAIYYTFSWIYIHFFEWLKFLDTLCILFPVRRFFRKRWIRKIWTFYVERFPVIGNLWRWAVFRIWISLSQYFKDNFGRSGHTHFKHIYRFETLELFKVNWLSFDRIVYLQFQRNMICQNCHGN